MEGGFDLFESIMRGHWDVVVVACESHPDISEAKITKSEDTALHIAVSDGQSEVVFQLVESLGQNASNILKIKNDKGNTPLHLAAALGHVDICRCIASKDPTLIAECNNESETPLFLAARLGKKEAFLCLNHFSEGKYTASRNRKGDTVLHAAIVLEDFRLAFQIIRCSPELVNSVNENGLTPLHILASKPNAFLSSTQLQPVDRFIYNFVLVDELKEEKYDHRTHRKISKTITCHNYPQNYETCMTFIRAMKSFIRVFTKPACEAEDEENNGETLPKKEIGDEEIGVDQRSPPNYTTFVLFLKLTAKALLILLGVGKWRINKITEMKKIHTWATQLMNELVDCASLYTYEENGGRPRDSRMKKDEYHFSVPEEPAPSEDADMHRRADTSTESAQPSGKNETPLLIAAKMGVAEMVEKILDKFPAAVQDLNTENKNLVLLAVENRQTLIYQLLLNRKTLGETVFRHVDNQGNSALHLAAGFRKGPPSLTPGIYLQMQWEIQWYRSVEKSMPPYFFPRENNMGQTPQEIFENTHMDLLKDDRDRLCKTTESSSVIAALIATVAYESSTNVPGGLDQTSGKPIFENELAFNIFTIASLVALSSSLTSLLCFVAILSSKFQENHFATDLPRKLLVGLTFLFISVASMLISFCTSQYLILRDNMRSAVYPLHIVAFFPITFLALSQCHIYFHLITSFRMSYLLQSD